MAICRGNNYNSECVLQVFAKNIDGLNYENDQNLFPACDCLLLPPANEVLGQGNIFARVCHSVHRGGSTWAGTPPVAGTPPGREIRATSGRYASYWNAFLLNNNSGLSTKFFNLVYDN